jgi:hypothetical protein
MWIERHREVHESRLASPTPATIEPDATTDDDLNANNLGIRKIYRPTSVDFTGQARVVQRTENRQHAFDAGRAGLTHISFLLETNRV